MARAAPAPSGVDDAERRFLTDEDVGLAVVERRDDRLRLDVDRSVPLERLRNVVRLKPPNAVEKTRSSAEPMMLLFALAIAETGLPPRSTMLISGCRSARIVGRVRALDQLVEELAVGAQVVLQAELLDVGPVDEDDLRLDAELRRTDVQAAHELGDSGRCGCGCR